MDKKKKSTGSFEKKNSDDVAKAAISNIMSRHELANAMERSWGEALKLKERKQILEQQVCVSGSSFFGVHPNTTHHRDLPALEMLTKCSSGWILGSRIFLLSKSYPFYWKRPGGEMKLRTRLINHI